MAAARALTLLFSSVGVVLHNGKAGSPCCTRSRGGPRPRRWSRRSWPGSRRRAPARGAPCCRERSASARPHAARGAQRRRRRPRHATATLRPRYGHVTATLRPRYGHVTATPAMYACLAARRGGGHAWSRCSWDEVRVVSGSYKPLLVGPYGPECSKSIAQHVSARGVRGVSRARACPVGRHTLVARSWKDV
jgi:hypothetical protein